MNRWVLIAVLLGLLILIVTCACRRIVKTIKDDEASLDDQCDTMTAVLLVAGMSTLLIPAIGYIATHPFAR